MNSVKIKICGITSSKEAQMLKAAEVDYAGLILFYEKSKRYNTVENAWQVLRYMDPGIQKVAVTVSPTPAQLEMIERMDFQVLQIHGELSEAVLSSCRLPIWRAYHISPGAVPQCLDERKITGYVLDGPRPGSGKSFDWQGFRNFKRSDKKLILAGGLRADNVREAIDLLQPDVVDVSTGVEGVNGKDAGKIQEFIRKVKEHE